MKEKRTGYKPSKAVYSRSISARLTPSEYNKIREYTWEHEITIAELIRKTILAEVEK